ncbi:MAG: Bug family tripartite tricarboxylate transporter substrate binding protein [Burkholderiales bacterium]
MKTWSPSLALAATLIVAAAPASAQTYPARPVRVIVPYAAGGNTDIVMRAIAAKASDAFGQQIVVDNRPGGGTNIGSELVAKAPGDGYLLLMAGAANAINMSLFANPPYDTLRDFVPVILCTRGANLLSIHPSLPAKDLKQLIAVAKSRPGALNFASAGIGSSNQMAGELLKVMAGINIVHVPYKGNAPALTDVVAGHVEMIFSGVTAPLPHLRSGRLRAIAIGSLKRFPAVPEVPTFDESGLKGYEAITWFGLVAPVKTPKEIVARWNTEVGKVIASPDIRERFTSDGQEPVGGSPEEFARFIRNEIDKYAKVVKAAGLKPQ